MPRTVRNGAVPAEGGLMVEVAGNQRIPPESPHRRRFPSNRTASASHGLADMVSAALLEIGARP